MEGCLFLAQILEMSKRSWTKQRAIIFFSFVPFTVQRRVRDHFKAHSVGKLCPTSFFVFFCVLYVLKSLTIASTDQTLQTKSKHQRRSHFNKERVRCSFVKIKVCVSCSGFRLEIFTLVSESSQPQKDFMVKQQKKNYIS